MVNRSNASPSHSPRNDPSDNASAIPPDVAEQHLAAGADDAIPTRMYRTLPVVGLGGSAGCLKPLQEFLAAMPPDSGMAFVVITHLSPEHDSALAEILQRSTRMSVQQVTENVRVVPNRVYVIPPRKHLTMLDGHITLNDLERERGRRVSVDLFFRTLADTHGPNAVAVVLSGADSDGSIGIKRVKERGGLTIIQDPQEAEQIGMPRSALETGMVDWILRAAEMPARILAFRQNASRLKLPRDDEGAVPSASETESETKLRDILHILRTHTGRDFAPYKRATILRRIARRMQVNGVENLGDYQGFLRTNPGEAGALLHDLLISVTNFFRDRDAFEALAGFIPEIFKGKRPGDVVRAWVPACATGEEAYSIAILLLEHASTMEAPPQIQVFATDIDEDAIAVARAGNYSEAINADVSESRIRRFFTKHSGHYRINQAPRETVLFAVHDVLKDAPFSRLDLVSCRNLLIYLNREAQIRAFEVFHFATRADGGLFLGPSETAEDVGSLFAAVDKKHRLYRRRNINRFGPLNPSAPLPIPLSSPVQQEQRPALPFLPNIAADQFADIERSTDPTALSPSALHFKLIEMLSPPSIVTNHEGTIIHLSASAGRYLQFGGGVPTSNIVQLVHPMLRADLRAAIFRASQTKVTADVSNLEIELQGVRKVVDLSVRPAPQFPSEFFLVVFSERSAPEVAPVAPSPEEPEGLVHSLERELEYTKQQLRCTLEQHSASTEEMKAANEELQAMNEELRSASEELETSREELQSINEELTTVNAELKTKVDELARANSDLQNLMGATNIATVFLDRDLRISRYTLSSVSLFNFIPSDTGRPLSDLTNRLEFSSLAADAGQVLRDLKPIEREVRGLDKRWFLARLTPYRTTENHIAGVVLTFIDITERKEAEDAVRASESRFRAFISQNAAGICGSDNTGRLIFVNRKLCELLGWTEAELLGKRFWEVAQKDGSTLFEQAQDSSHPFQLEKCLYRKDGTMLWANVSVSFIRDASGNPLSAIAVIVDTTERRRSEEALRASRQRLAATFSQAAVGLSELSTEGKFLRVNDYLCRLLGRSREELLTSAVSEVTHPDDLPATLAAVKTLIQTGAPQSVDKRYLRPDGTFVWANSSLTRLDDDDGHPRGILAVTADLTERRNAEAELRHASDKLELRVTSRTTELNSANRELRKQIAERISAEEARQDMTRQLVTAQEEERGRISRELHDQVGQHLTALMLGLKALSNGTTKNPDTLLQGLLATTEKVGKEIHDLAVELRPTSLDDLGLLRTLTNYLEEWSARTKIPVEFHHSDWPDKRLASHIETVFYRIVCEALNNVSKHAHATSVSVILEQRGGQAVAIVEDNGTGFDEEAMLQPSSRKTLGVVGMKERAALVNGELKIESIRDKGTTVFVRVPLLPKAPLQ